MNELHPHNRNHIHIQVFEMVLSDIVLAILLSHRQFDDGKQQDQLKINDLNDKIEEINKLENLYE